MGVEGSRLWQVFVPANERPFHIFGLFKPGQPPGFNAFHFQFEKGFLSANNAGFGISKSLELALVVGSNGDQ